MGKKRKTTTSHSRLQIQENGQHFQYFFFLMYINDNSLSLCFLYYFYARVYITDRVYSHRKCLIAICCRD